MKTTKYWIVFVGKREYKLTETQFNFMKKENEENGLQTFWFDKFVISLPHISSMEFVTETIQGVPELPEMTKEDHQKAREKLNELRGKLRIKGTLY